MYTYTLGTAPNRIHYINFFGLSRKNVAIGANADIIATSILLYEGTGGKFQIINGGAYGGAVLQGTVGCENADGTAATQLAGAPATAYSPSASAENADNIIYEFVYGTQPSVDMAGISHNLQTNINKTSTITVSGKLANYGSTAVTSLTLNYTVNGGTVISENKTGLNIAPGGGTYDFTHGSVISTLTAGQVYDLKIWASDINGGSADEDNTNDTLSAASIAINGTAAPKTILVEEGSGGWCGFCPDGHLVLKDIISRYNNVIGVVHHNADGMVNAQSDIINGTYITGYPAGLVDRVKFSSEPGVQLTRDKWENKINERLSAAVPCVVSIINKSYDDATRKITFTVKATFMDYYGGDMRLNAFVVEDNIRGNNVNNTWTQHNYYSQQYQGGVGGPSHPLYTYPEWIVGYRHNHVVREYSFYCMGRCRYHRPLCCT